MMRTPYFSFAAMTRRRLLSGGLASFVILVAGCSNGGGSVGGGGSGVGATPFMKQINSLRPGTSQASVREQLGPPDTKRVGIVTSPPPPGATENLPAAAPVGTAYQQWIYKRDDSQFHVFFARDRDRAGGWKVIQVHSTSAN